MPDGRPDALAHADTTKRPHRIDEFVSLILHHTMHRPLLHGVVSIATPSQRADSRQVHAQEAWQGTRSYPIMDSYIFDNKIINRD